MLALIAVAELLGMSLWFAASAAAPQLTLRWDLSPSQVGGLATAVQLGFVLGTATSALLNLADVVPARRLFAVCAVLGAGTNALLLVAASGACALAIGLTFGRAPWIVAVLALIWGFFVIADSAQFSVLVTESVPSHAVGTALTVQVCLGFLLTTLTIQLVPPVVARVGWEGAFALLAVGPALGILALRRLPASGHIDATRGTSGRAPGAVGQQ